MIVRSRAPLRIGLAGGGTDVSPYSDEYGGCILNATINMFAYTTIETRDDGLLSFQALDMKKSYSASASEEIAASVEEILATIEEENRNIKNVEASSDEGKKLIKKFGIEYAPAFVFEKTLM